MDSISKQMVEWLSVKHHHKVLEPNAGQGHIIKYLPNDENVCAMDSRHDNIVSLMERFPKLSMVENEFTQIHPNKRMLFHRIIMVPPLHDHKDLYYYMHAVEFLKPKGILVMAVNETAFTKRNMMTKCFREHLQLFKGQVVKSDTMIAHTQIRLIKFTKP